MSDTAGAMTYAIAVPSTNGKIAVRTLQMTYSPSSSGRMTIATRVRRFQAASICSLSSQIRPSQRHRAIGPCGLGFSPRPAPRLGPRLASRSPLAYTAAVHANASLAEMVTWVGAHLDAASYRESEPAANGLLLDTGEPGVTKFAVAVNTSLATIF